MKLLFLIVALPILSSCANQTTADKIDNMTAKTSPTVNNVSNGNVNTRIMPPNEPVDMKNSELVRESVKEIETSETNVMNYAAQISINE